MNLHATCIAVEDRGLLITGPSGAGKSSLALQMMALGARLVADDRVVLTCRDGAVFATCPPALSGLIEARGFGILRADPVHEVRLVLVADLERPPTTRLPPEEKILLLDCAIDLVGARSDAHFSASLLQLLRHGRAQ